MKAESEACDHLLHGGVATVSGGVQPCAAWSRGTMRGGTGAGSAQERGGLGRCGPVWLALSVVKRIL